MERTSYTIENDSTVEFQENGNMFIVPRYAIVGTETKLTGFKTREEAGLFIDKYLCFH
jgi:hypothetical protein